MAKFSYRRLFLVCNHVTRRPCWWSIQKKFFGKICIKIEFISQRRETLLFLTPNMAAVTSLANQQYYSVGIRSVMYFPLVHVSLLCIAFTTFYYLYHSLVCDIHLTPISHQLHFCTDQFETSTPPPPPGHTQGI